MVDGVGRARTARRAAGGGGGRRVVGAAADVRGSRRGAGDDDVAGVGGGDRACRRGRRGGARRVVLRRLGGDARQAELVVGEHGPQVHLAGDLDERFGLLLVLHAGKVDDDGVTLAEDLRLGDAEAVDALADPVDGEVEAGRVERRRTGCCVTEMPPCRSRPSDGCVAVDERGDQPAERQDQRFRRANRSASCASTSSARRPLCRRVGSIFEPRPEPSSLGTAVSPFDVSTLRCNGGAGDADLHVVVDLQPGDVAVEQR